MQQNTLSQWGCQDRYQAHFIVIKETSANVYDFAARTVLSTTGHFNAKKISSVEWNGGKIAQILNKDTALNEIKDFSMYGVAFRECIQNKIKAGVVVSVVLEVDIHIN